MMKSLLSQIVLILVILLAGKAQVTAQCIGPMSVTVIGAGTGKSLSAVESHVDAVCPDGSGMVTITGTGGTEPYVLGTGTFPQAVGTQIYTVQDMMGCSATISVTITATNPRPTGVLSGSATICNGNPATLSIAVTGTGPFSGILSDDTPFSGAGPTLTVNVSPAISTPYTISTLSDVNCSSLSGDLTGGATVSVLNCTNISGRIIWEGDYLTTMTGVNNTTVRLTGDANDLFLTGSNGNYMLSTAAGNNFLVTPKKNLPMPFATNGLTAIDASRIQQHIVGIMPITDPYKLIAADANRNNTVTTADATLIQQAQLGNPAAQAVFISKTWRFVPKDHVFTNPASPWGFPENIEITSFGTYADLDFIGIKLGDVNSDADAFNRPDVAPNLVWAVKDKFLAKDTTYMVEFRAQHFEDLLALQFGIQFDPAKLEFLGMENVAGSPLQSGNFGLYNVAAGEIRAFLAMSQGVSLPDGTPGFRIQFKSMQDGILLSEALQFNDDLLLGEAYLSDYTPGPVTLVYESATTATIEPASASVELFQNRPNPFSSETNIGFVLPNGGKAELRIYEASGRVVFSKAGNYPVGYHELVFKPTDLAPGLLYYELITDEGRLSRKMVMTGKE